MSRSPKDARILVASDSADDAAQVRRALFDDFHSVEVSSRPELAVADFERVMPDVVVLAFEVVEKSQQYCLGLLRLSKVAHAHPHRTVILCGKDDLGSVFDLCKKEYFDDYVLYWPQSHDGRRLAMSVWNACRRAGGSNELGLGTPEIVAHAESARELGAVVDRRIDDGIRHVDAARRSLADVGRGLGSTRAHDRAKPSLAAASDHLTQMSAWAQGFKDEVAPRVADAHALADKLQPARPVVLVVEDDPFAAKLIVKTLEKQSFDVAQASNAPGALARLRTLKPAAIFMDVNLPGMDGVALTEWLKASPNHSRIPVIMLTGDSRRETIARSMAAGAVGFIVKPFTREGLLAKLAPFVH
ncbi:MAG: response regulator [Caldimonas sp.]